MSSSLFSSDPAREDTLLAWFVDQELRCLTPNDPSYCPAPLPPISPAHGIIIGIDYDLGYQPDDEFLADWQGYLPGKELRLLAPASGLRGPTAAYLYRTLPEIMIPWEPAFRFFREKTLPRYLFQAAQIWPQFAALSPEQRCALTSLIKDRGASLVGRNRGEMGLIAEYLSLGETAPIPSLFRAQAYGARPRTRQARRLAEAALFESSPTTTLSRA